jgi:hypothetical protein
VAEAEDLYRIFDEHTQRVGGGQLALQTVHEGVEVAQPRSTSLGEARYGV